MAEASWTEQPIHFIDFEGNLRSGILEYGVATLRAGQITATHTRLCAPKARILEDETAVHGLREDDLRGCAPISEDWIQFSGWRASGPLAAHSAAAENSLLKSVWPYPSLSTDHSRPGELRADWGPWLDSAAIYPVLFPSLGSAKLGELVSSMGLQTELDGLALAHCPENRRHYHCALYDALAGALLLCALARFEETAKLSLPRLFVLSARSGEKRDEIQQGLFGF